MKVIVQYMKIIYKFSIELSCITFFEFNETSFNSVFGKDSNKVLIIEVFHLLYSAINLKI